MCVNSRLNMFCYKMATLGIELIATFRSVSCLFMSVSMVTMFIVF